MYKVEVGKWLASKMRAVVQPGAEFGLASYPDANTFLSGLAGGEAGELSLMSLSPLTLLWFPTTTDKYCCEILLCVKGTMFSRMDSYLSTRLWGGVSTCVSTLRRAIFF